MSILIVGGDSRLSKYLVSDLIKKKYKFIKTSRRNSNNDIYLNFENVDNFSIPNNINFAVIVGGITSYDECDNKYDYAFKINCVNIPKLISRLLEKDIFIIYISTNTVFKYNLLPNEKDLPSPAFPYANLKYISEQEISKLAIKQNKIDKLSILRLTKNVCENTSPFNDWIKFIYKKQNFNAFNDLYFAPIRFNDSSKAIIKIIETKSNGIFHLSGEKDLSYADFAIGFLSFLKINQELCNKIDSRDIGVKLRYNHNVTALSMKYTTKKLNLEPIKLDKIYNYLKKFIK
tara:strand:- start:154 stop:1020 length:867 start_codon:yes stop_codon:yes gene_type:complete